MTEQDIARLMDEYRTNVKALFENKSAEFASNSSGRHASILIEEMILHAQHTFDAFAGRMNPEVWNERVMTALADAIARGVHVQLVVENECAPISNGTMPQTVRPFVRRLPQQAIDGIKQVITHCASGDGESMRIEMDPAQKSAVFAANNPETASKVASVVSGLFNIGVPYDHAA